MYVELHARSAFSFLEATPLPEALAERAAQLEQPALALVDADGLYGAPQLYRACTRLGLKAIVGAEVTLDGGGRLPLLVEDREGYKNLCRLLTRIKMRAPKGEGAATLDDLVEHAAGLVCLTGGAGGPVAARLAPGRRGGRGRSPPAPGDRLRPLQRLRRAAAPSSRAQEAQNDWLRARAPASACRSSPPMRPGSSPARTGRCSTS